MARRWQTEGNEQLTPGELVELRNRLLAMKPHGLENFYKATHNACRYEIQGRVPSAAMMQELIQAGECFGSVRGASNRVRVRGVPLPSERFLTSRELTR
jgi:hypothetical protein